MPDRGSRWAVVRSLVAVAGVLVGVPALLWWATGNPFSADTWQSLSDGWGSGLAPEITPTAVARLLGAVCWLAWLLLAAAVVAELYHAALGGTSRRLRALSPFQAAAALIVAPLALTMTGLPAAAKTTAAPAAAAAVTGTVAARPVPVATGDDEPAPGYYRVRMGDTLDRVAEEQLGDRARWRELWDLNRDQVMNDGRVFIKLTGLREGWDLKMPPVPAAVPRTLRAVPTRPGVLPPAQASVPAGSVLTPAVNPWVVERGQSLWRIAQLAYGVKDTATVQLVVDAIFAANRDQLRDPDQIDVGMAVQLPSVTVPSEAAPVAAPAEEALAPSAPTWTVEHGQYLWRIAQLAYGVDDTPTLERIVTAIFEANRDQISDPDRIYTGMTLRLPVVPASPDGATAVVDEAVPASSPVEVDPRVSEPSGSGAPVALGGAETPDGGAATLPPPTTNAAPPPDAPAVPSPVPPPSRPPVTAGATPPEADDDETLSLFDQAQRTVWWSIPMGVLLASGIMLMVRRLRGRRMTTIEPGEQLAGPPPVAAGTEVAVNSVSLPVRLSTLQRLLRSVTPHARALNDPPPVRAVELSDDRVEVLFAEPAPFPPAGWTSVDGGRSWVHRLDPSGEVEPPAVKQLVTPALVTVGHRPGGGEVLLDVETAGCTGLVGDREGCVGLARSIVLELGTYPLGVPMDVCLVGVDVDGVERCDRVWTHTTMTRAVRVARTMLERTTDTGAPSLVAARAALDEDDGTLDPQVFVVDRTGLSEGDQLLLDELVELCQPQAGAAVVVIGGHRAARETVQVNGDGTARWAGTTLTAPVLSREAVAQVAVMFDQAAAAPAEPLAPSPVVADLLAADDADDHPVEAGADETGEEDGDDKSAPVYVPPTPAVLVRLIGEVRVEGRPIDAPSEVELLALLVCLRDQCPNIDTITTFLQGDLPWQDDDKDIKGITTKTVLNRLSTLRRRLGCDEDGVELLPTSKGGRQAGGHAAVGRYTVSPRVMTDVELLEHRYQTSLGLTSQEALIVLRDGLELMGGPAFRARKGYSWASGEGVQGKLACIINTYAARLMELAFEADDLPLVLETCRWAGRVIDDAVLELPMLRRQAAYAEASGDSALCKAVSEAKRRLRDYIDDTDTGFDPGPL